VKCTASKVQVPGASSIRKLQFHCMCDSSVRTVWPALPPEYRAGSGGGRAPGGKVAAAVLGSSMPARGSMKPAALFPLPPRSRVDSCGAGVCQGGSPGGRGPHAPMGRDLDKPRRSIQSAERWEGEHINRRGSRPYSSSIRRPTIEVSPDPCPVLRAEGRARPLSPINHTCNATFVISSVFRRVASADAIVV
jgi:hypothetical protein